MSKELKLFLILISFALIIALGICLKLLSPEQTSNEIFFQLLPIVIPCCLYFSYVIIFNNWRIIEIRIDRLKIMIVNISSNRKDKSKFNIIKDKANFLNRNPRNNIIFEYGDRFISIGIHQHIDTETLDSDVF